jgi:hypothetical protein
MDNYHQAILDTVILFEKLYEGMDEALGKEFLYRKEHYLPNDNHVKNKCYLCDYSYNISGHLQTEMCQFCPCMKHLGDKCSLLNEGIGSDLLNSSTIKWGLRNAYKIASRAKVDCDFKYWIKVRRSRSK